MIIVKITGGIGNQMFQYAFARNIAYELNTELKLDISIYNDPNEIREYELDNFNIYNNIATNFEIKYYKNNNILDILRRYFFAKKKYFKEKEFNFNLDIPKFIKEDTYFDGYWQSEKYFKQIEEIIRLEFTLREEPDAISKQICNNMNIEESVSIHVRRGDYANNPRTNEYHGLCSPNYYKNAINLICEKISNPHFFIFSDDIDWVRKNLTIPFKLSYINHNSEEKDYIDLWLMSRCKHHIIANSSFSWWGAWLSENKHKIVIAPKKWFNKPDINTKDLIPDSWLRI